ncbi:MAG: tRNA (N(6)-L-threonylcarbamoyladenosine(37)-C(2))-methylthiotransferase MtaB [Lactimicrobium massiliense]|nr:tRNA (N(6)-L-threonylcarbamoyladenosine(37)-C(2))-methylthiotransferase MtaB [Lactimicrobium massiliense]MDD6458597.1 tRNA (N(6)-L-threonylcarbamoyladenosine(37)-C(2))-methylthiotransferase MtaB [Lactimicrobium massiliense]
MKFSVCNLGCKVNAFEAESIAHTLEEEGWQRVPFEQSADAVLIFTCAVTNMAAQKSRKMMHRARRISPNGAIAMIGCYAEVADEALQDADLVIGTREKKNVPQHLKEFMETHRRISLRGGLDHLTFDNLQTTQFENHTRAYLKVQDGCCQFCSYCIIPYARGKERSMAPDAVTAEAKRLSIHYPEIVLAGIHTGRYGREYGVTLAQLMKRILQEAPDLKRLRISSIEQNEVTDELIELIREEPRIARHLHIPLQSGSDPVLKRMRRPYDTAAYLAKLEKIRSEIPDIAISCDLIAGFPGETEQEFDETLAFLQKCRFSFIHAFPYSMRQGTVAAGMRDQIDPRIKKERTRRVLELSQKLSDAYQQQWIDKDVQVIVETHKDGYSVGHASQYFPVSIRGSLPRGMYDVHVQAYESHALYGCAKETI